MFGDRKQRREDGARRQQASAIWNEAREAFEAGETRYGFTYMATDVRPTFGPKGAFEEFSHAQIVGQVEALGWELTHVDHVFIPTSSPTMSGFGGTGSNAARGLVQAHYLFKRP